jgi:hypothetical protein
MKGLKLNIKICIITALVLGILMAVLNIYQSWSQHHLSDLEPLLYIVLLCISFSYLMASFEHKNELKEITKVFGMSFRLEHAFRLNAYLFAGVIIFGVNSSIAWVEIAHFIFTGLSIILGYLTMLTYSSSKRYYLHTAIGLGGFILGFIFGLYSTSWAEVIAAIPLALFLYTTLDETTS